MMKEDFFEQSDLFNDLYYLTKGKSKCSPSHGYGPTVREFYLIHFILSGEGSFYCSNKQYKLREGQFFLIHPGELTYYEADNENPWEYCWIGFEGATADKLLSRIGLTIQNPVGDIQEFKSLKKEVDELSKTDPYSFTNRLKLQGQLYRILSYLSPNEHFNYDIKRDGNKQFDYFSKSINFMKDNYQNTDFSVKQISEHLNINSSYLTSIIKEMSGKTLKDFLIEFRLQESRKYLETTDLSIKEIANKVGYENSLSFTRIFKQYLNMTPQEYRKNWKSKL